MAPPDPPDGGLLALGALGRGDGAAGAGRVLVPTSSTWFVGALVTLASVFAAPNAAPSTRVCRVVTVRAPVMPRTLIWVSPVNSFDDEVRDVLKGMLSVRLVALVVTRWTLTVMASVSGAATAGATLSAAPTAMRSCTSASPTVPAVIVFFVVLPSATMETCLGVTSDTARPLRPMVCERDTDRRPFSSRSPMAARAPSTVRSVVFT